MSALRGCQVEGPLNGLRKDIVDVKEKRGNTVLDS